MPDDSELVALARHCQRLCEDLAVHQDRLDEHVRDLNNRMTLEIGNLWRALANLARARDPRDHRHHITAARGEPPPTPRQQDQIP